MGLGSKMTGSGDGRSSKPSFPSILGSDPVDPHQLREHAYRRDKKLGGRPSNLTKLMRKAADEIERLRALIPKNSQSDIQD